MVKPEELNQYNIIISSIEYASLDQSFVAFFKINNKNSKKNYYTCHVDLSSVKYMEIVECFSKFLPKFGLTVLDTKHDYDTNYIYVIALIQYDKKLIPKFEYEKVMNNKAILDYLTDLFL